MLTETDESVEEYLVLALEFRECLGENLWIYELLVFEDSSDAWWVLHVAFALSEFLVGGGG